MRLAAGSSVTKLPIGNRTPTTFSFCFCLGGAQVVQRHRRRVGTRAMELAASAPALSQPLRVARRTRATPAASVRPSSRRVSRLAGGLLCQAVSRLRRCGEVPRWERQFVLCEPLTGKGPGSPRRTLGSTRGCVTCPLVVQLCTLGKHTRGRCCFGAANEGLPPHWGGRCGLSLLHSPSLSFPAGHSPHHRLLCTRHAPHS